MKCKLNMMILWSPKLPQFMLHCHLGILIQLANWIHFKLINNFQIHRFWIFQFLTWWPIIYFHVYINFNIKTHFHFNVFQNRLTAYINVHAVKMFYYWKHLTITWKQNGVVYITVIYSIWDFYIFDLLFLCILIFNFY